MSVQAQAVRANQRRIINGHDDVVQLYPIIHYFAWKSYEIGNANHWLPQEIGHGEDIQQWNTGKITEDEKHVVEFSLGFFTTADSIVANNLVLAVYKHITSPECRMYLLQQAFEECVHTHSYQYIVESLGLNEAKIFGAYKTIASIYDKDQFVSELVQDIQDPMFKTGDFASDQRFLENLIDFYLIMEGVFFYSSFAAILSLKRRNLLPGVAEQFEYICRDESMHLNFGIELINQLIAENPHLWTGIFKAKVIKKLMRAGELEEAYAQELLPNGILGLNKDSFSQYTKHIVDRRLNAVGINAVYNVKNPFGWMSEVIDLTKVKNFFEKTVTEYQTGGALEFEDDW